MNQSLKRIAFLVSAALFLFSFPETTSAQQWAKSMFQEFVHDFGDVPKGKKPEFRFEIENKFKEDIRIRGVRSSCGCTSAMLTKNVIKTWETSEVVCVFNSPSFNGFKQATVTVQFDAPFPAEVQLTVRGNIVQAFGLTLEPEEIDFGQVTETNLPEKVVSLESTGDPNFRIVDVKSSFPHISVSLNEKTRSASFVNYEMKTSLKPSVPSGAAEGELLVVIEERGQQRQVPIRFNAKVASIKISPEILTLSKIKPGQKIKKTVVLQSDREFEITDVKCETRAFSVKQKKKGRRKVHIVEVTYTGEDKNGTHECELSFFTSLNKDASGTVKAVIDIINDESSKTEFAADAK